MNAGQPIVGADAKRPWLVANVLAFIVGGGLAGWALRYLEQPYYGADVSAIAAASIQATSAGVSGAIFGAVLGTMQWLILRRLFRAGWWMPATCVGFALTGAISGFLAGGSLSTIGPDEGPVPPILGLLVGYPLVAAVLCGPQWLVLRRDVDRAALWPLGNLGGLIVGFGVAFVVVRSVLVDAVPVLAPTDFPSARAFVLIGAVGGCVYGAVTWAVLAELHGRRAIEALARDG